MKIHCELISRETYNVITSTDIESNSFGLSKDNPFPASHIWTGSFFGDSVRLVYIVREAYGDLGTYEPQEQEAA